MRLKPPALTFVRSASEKETVARPGRRVSWRLGHRRVRHSLTSGGGSCSDFFLKSFADYANFGCHQRAFLDLHVEGRLRRGHGRMEGYGGPAQPSPTIGQCLNRGVGLAGAECDRCKTRASLPLDAICRRRDTPLWKLRHYSNVVMAKGPVRAAGPHD